MGPAGLASAWRHGRCRLALCDAGCGEATVHKAQDANHGHSLAELCLLEWPWGSLWPTLTQSPCPSGAMMLQLHSGADWLRGLSLGSRDPGRLSGSAQPSWGRVPEHRAIGFVLGQKDTR